MTPAELLSCIDGGQPPVILDVRSAWEFTRGHVPGARHLPFWTIGARLDKVPGSADDLVVVYCGLGPRAWRAAGVLRRAGFTNVVCLSGHMYRWRRAGLPQETGRS